MISAKEGNIPSNSKDRPSKLKDLPSHQRDLPTTLKNVPDCIKHLVNNDDIVVCVKPDGACGANAAAGHIFEDPNEGPKFLKVINTHITDRWGYYKNKINFPYKRQVGVNGDWVHFVEAAEFIEFISTNDGSAFLWTDSEEILAIANLYQINIKVITLRTKEDLDPVTSFIVPDPDIKEFAMLPPGIVPDMILLHSEDSHFNLISSKQSRLVRNIEEKHKNKG